MNKILLCVLIVTSILLSSCFNTFKPQVVKGWTPTCNAMATIMHLEKNDSEKKISVLAASLCFKSMRRLECRKEVFGVDPKTKEVMPVDYESKKLRDFAQCMSEKS